MAETIIGLSQSNAQMRTTIRYLDQIQRSTDRLGRTRYQSLIKTNNELRTTGRRLESIYSTAVRLSRLRIMPKIGLIDELSPALDRALAKLNSVRGQMVKASGTVLVDVKQKVEVEMGKMGPASGPSLALNIGNNKTINNSAPKEEEEDWMDKANKYMEFANNINDVFDNIIDKVVKVKDIFKKKKDDTPTPDSTSNPAASNPASRCCCCDGNKGGANRRNRSRSNAGNGGGGGRGGYRSGRRSSTSSNRGPRPNPNPNPNPGPDTSGRPPGPGRRRRIGRGLGFADMGSLGGFADLLSGGGMLDNLNGGFAKGAKKLLGPLSTIMSVADVVTAPPEERGRAVGSMIGGTAGTAIGSAIGSVLLPGIGTWVGGAVGGWAGSEVGGWIGDKAKDIGNFMSSATEGVGNALSGAADFVAEKTKNIFGGITDFFGGSKKEEAPAATTPAPVPSQPMPAPPYIPSALSITGPNAYLSGMGGGPTAAALAGPNLMQMQAMGMGTGAGAQAQAAGNGTPSTITVQISEEQMSSLAGYLTDFKTEVTNQVSVNVPAGAVQVTVRENAIDYDALALQIGGRLSNELRRAMENRRSTVMA